MLVDHRLSSREVQVENYLKPGSESAYTTATHSMDGLEVGPRVKLVGLVGGKQHNGKVGTVTTALDADSGRLMVTLDDGGGKQIMKLKPANVVKTSDKGDGGGVEEEAERVAATSIQASARRCQSRKAAVHAREVRRKEAEWLAAEETRKAAEVLRLFDEELNLAELAEALKDRLKKRILKTCSPRLLWHSEATAEPSDHLAMLRRQLRSLLQLSDRRIPRKGPWIRRNQNKH